MLLAVLSIVYSSWRNGISPMPSPAPVRQAVTAEIRRLPKQEGIVVEAGSGWGTMALQIARNHPGWSIIGIENAIIPLWVSQAAGRLTAMLGKGNRSKVAFMRGDLYRYRYDRADVVVCYLYPGAMKRLGPTFKEQLAPGARVISVCFALPGWEPERVVTCRDLYRTKVYIYSSNPAA